MRITYTLKKPRKDGSYGITLYVTNKSTEKEVKTGLVAYPKDLNKKGEIKNAAILDEVNMLIKTWNDRARELGVAIKDMTAKEIVAYILSYDTPHTEQKEWHLDFFSYVREDAMRLYNNNQDGTSKLRITALNSLKSFLKTERLEINSLTSSMLRKWVEHLEKNSGGRAASLYVAQLKAVFNRARLEYNDEQQVRIPFEPFSKIKVKQPAPQPRSISKEQMRAIMQLPDNESVRFNNARDIFVLSFLLLGMNSADMYHLSARQPDKGRFTYERQKTRTRRADKALISIAIPPEAEAIINKYKASEGAYYFDFKDRFSTIGTFSASLNKGLKEVGKAVKIENLTFYSARHTWATIAYNDAKIDKGVVSDALNHVDPSMSVTDRYIRKDWSRIDEANRKVIDLVLSE